MRTQNGRDEVLLVTYTDGTVERFPEAVEILPNMASSETTIAVFGESLSRKLAVLVTANVRKWEWVEQ